MVRLYVMIHDVRPRKLIVWLSVVTGLAMLCGGTFVVDSWRTRQEQSQSDRAMQAYLDSLARRDYNAAYTLVCTDETGIDQRSFEQSEREDPIRSFEIESSSNWSSPVDGHGRIYRVRIIRATGGEIVEIYTQAYNPCIQYANIRRQ